MTRRHKLRALVTRTVDIEFILSQENPFERFKAGNDASTL